MSMRTFYYIFLVSCAENLWSALSHMRHKAVTIRSNIVAEWNSWASRHRKSHQLDCSMGFWNPQVQHTAALAWFNIDLIQPSISLFFSRTLGSSWKLLWTCFFLAGHASIAPPAPLLSGGMSPCVFQACCFTSAFALLGKPKGQIYATPKFRQKKPGAIAKSATAMGNVIAAFGEEGIKLFPFAAVVSWQHQKFGVPGCASSLLSPSHWVVAISGVFKCCHKTGLNGVAS